MIDASDLMGNFITALQITAAALLFTFRLDSRIKTWQRALAYGAFLVVVTGLGLLIPGSLRTAQPWRFFAGQCVTFLVALALLVLLTLLSTKASALESLFYSASAYTMQNLSSALVGFAHDGLLMVNVGISQEALLLLAILLPVPVYALCYHLLIKRIDSRHLLGTQSPDMVFLIGVVALVTVIFDLANKTIPLLTGTLSIVLVLRTVHAVMCAFILYAAYEMLFNKRLQQNAAILSKLLEDSARQYQLSKETIDAINLKCHDLKHQIRQLREHAADSSLFDEMENSISIYDSAVKTGNEALDTIITEKSLICERDKISLSCIADGSALDFMAPSDLYTLFGNILDNAIEATLKVPTEDGRDISLTVRKRRGMVLIHEENHFVGSILFEGELPVTDKRLSTGERDLLSHGYGMKSMSLIAERYAGSLSCKVSGNVFSLDLLVTGEGR